MSLNQLHTSLEDDYSKGYPSNLTLYIASPFFLLVSRGGKPIFSTVIRDSFCST